jgi:hypothetical protein
MLLVVEKGNEVRNGAVKVNVVFPEGVVGVEQQYLSSGELHLAYCYRKITRLVISEQAGRGLAEAGHGFSRATKGLRISAPSGAEICSFVLARAPGSPAFCAG